MILMDPWKAIEMSGSYEMNVDALELRRDVQKVLKSLTPREERVVRCYFGIDIKEMNFGEIGLDFEISASRVRQIMKKAMQKLRHPSRSKRLRDPAISNSPSPDLCPVCRSSVKSQWPYCWCSDVRPPKQHKTAADPIVVWHQLRWEWYHRLLEDLYPLTPVRPWRGLVNMTEWWRIHNEYVSSLPKPPPRNPSRNYNPLTKFCRVIKITIEDRHVVEVPVSEEWMDAFDRDLIEVRLDGKALPKSPDW